MERRDTLTDAEAQYLAQIWEDCAACLGPDTELLDLRLEPAVEDVRLVARYRLGIRERESSASDETLLAAHADLRARIVVDRIGFGLSDLLDRR